ncbi:hypothetical protein GS531_00525 [Rhodococcus hoagii]|nr:hypothetical protein [Prescottella equi]
MTMLIATDPAHFIGDTVSAARARIGGRRSDRGAEEITWVIIAAGVAAVAVAIVAFIGPKVQEYLNKIQ